MAERQKSEIKVYDEAAVRARQDDPMPPGNGWRLLNIQRNPAINFQSILVSAFSEKNERFGIFQVRPWTPGEQPRRSKIEIDGVVPVRASKEDPLPLGKDWRILNIRGAREGTNPAVDFQSTLVSAFNGQNERFAVFKIRPWPAVGAD
jgi:hypothetical protein